MHSDTSINRLGGKTMNFGEALELLKEGERICRETWADRNMFIYLVEGRHINRELLRNNANEHIPNMDKVEISSHIDMFTGNNNERIVSYTPLVTDLLAEDWKLAE